MSRELLTQVLKVPIQSSHHSFLKGAAPLFSADHVFYPTILLGKSSPTLQAGLLQPPALLWSSCIACRVLVHPSRPGITPMAPAVLTTGLPGKSPRLYPSLLQRVCSPWNKGNVPNLILPSCSRSYSGWPKIGRGVRKELGYMGQGP